jgi:hypothetical protein
MYDLYIVRRTQIYLDEEQAERLASRAAAEGTTLSALIREAIDELLERGGEGERLAGFRRAVEASAGLAPELPEGRSYVEELRRRDLERERELSADPA